MHAHGSLFPGFPRYGGIPTGLGEKLAIDALRVRAWFALVSCMAAASILSIFFRRPFIRSSAPARRSCRRRLASACANYLSQVPDICPILFDSLLEFLKGTSAALGAFHVLGYLV